MWRRASVFAVHIAILGSLTACSESPFSGSETADSDTQTSSATPSSPTSQTNDGSDSLSQPQSVVVAQANPTVVEIPDVAAATPEPTPIVVNPFTPVPQPTSEPDEEQESEPDDSPDEVVANSDSDTDGNTGSDAGADSEAELDTADNSPESTETPETGVADSQSSPTDNGDTDLAETDVDDSDSAATDTEASTDDNTQDAETTDDSAPETDVAEESSDDTAEQDSTDSIVAIDPADSGETEQSKAEAENNFSSHTTAGFIGKIVDDSIQVSWEVEPGALGYNVYLEGKYVTTVWENSYVETDLYDQNYYYEIQSFDETKKIYWYNATGLTVKVRSAGRVDSSRATAKADLLNDYQLIFSDEFTGSTLDTSKWNTALLWGDQIIINGEVQFYVDINNKPDFGFNPFTFDGEHLTINSIKTPSELSEKAKGQPYLSGVITSYDALQFIYGYAETRAKVTFGRGYWPAFWLLNAYYGQGGDDPEIDIMEFIGHDQDVVYHTYHYYDENGELRSTKSQPTPGVDYSEDFHTFGVEWKPGTIIYYVDGIEVHRVVDPKVSQQTMYVIANTAMGGWWAGDPDETTPFPGEFMIDYIRVYQRTTPYDDVLFNDDMTGIPFADEIPGSAIPNHRPTPAQWPAGYPHAQ
ncbi:Endo-1,3-1,4-beta-glycanase ExsH [Granulosicoccus antarcticus IMCC3135]|uniref:Endo-1,3-1,4-beta-glycanase ExsH n=2 Tax=Granulosicoccus TaxID=437504 RepID=A0A2Z2NME6_9GAMM|nr:Endo-1,3-1,4-beta-glycanase ExsH [Granulosicoccus antarcticus IMCC3135]